MPTHHPQFFFHTASNLPPPSNRMGQKAPNDFIAVGTSTKRGVDGPHPLHAIESMAGRLIVYDLPIGFDFGGNLI